MVHSTEKNLKANAASASEIRWTFVLLALAWTLVALMLTAWERWETANYEKGLLLSQARPFFNQIVLTRKWNSSHGGVYVPITDDTRPNPFLTVPNRDIETKDGTRLTLINPAYMTRQLGELAVEKDQTRFHLTSAKPIRPKNSPDPWEAKALGYFEQGAKEYFETVDDAEGAPVFRYMAPLWVEDSCLKCHSVQGYKVGDLRGGLSVTFSAQPAKIATAQTNKVHAVTHFIVWLLGIMGLFFSARILEARARDVAGLVTRLERTLSGLVPICASCKNIRSESGQWEQLEQYICDHSEAKFSHSICPNCMQKIYGIDLSKLNESSDES